MIGDALVIGNGHMGRFHARTLRDLGYAVTTVDPDPTAGADMATVDRWDWDAAVVATPVQCLVPYALRLLRAGTPTLVEKPVSIRVDDVQRVADVQAETGTPCAVGFVERFNPRVIEVKAKLGGSTTAIFTRINDRPTWNINLDLTLHDVDLALFLGLDPAVCTFRTVAGAGRKVRRIDTPYVSVDLTDHAESPLHGLWRAFMAGAGYPTLTDAVAAHRALMSLDLEQPVAVAA